MVSRPLKWSAEGILWWFRAQADRFVLDAEQYATRSRRTLERILAANGNTVWGRAHGLQGPHALEAFQSLPPFKYDDYAPFIARAAEGEPHVLTTAPIVYFAETSGTTGIPKLIPLIRHQTANLTHWGATLPYGLALRAGLLGRFCGPVFMAITQFKEHRTSGGIPVGAVTSGGVKQLGWRKHFITAPLEVIRVQPQATARYLHLLFALREDDLWVISAIFPSILLYIFQDLKERAPQLLRDLASGTLSPDLELSTEERAQIAALLKPQPERARVLERRLSQKRWTVRDLWPGVGCIFTATGGPFRFYVDQLRPYLGGLPVYSPIYGASEEAGIGFSLSPEQPGYVLNSREAYLELMPLSETGEPLGPPLPAEQAGIGHPYEMVITNASGLFRFRLGDVLRVTGFLGEAPTVEFIERRGGGLNLLGEKTSEHLLVETCEAVFREIGIPLIDYFMTVDLSAVPGRYLLVVEFPPAAAENSPALQGLLEMVETRLRRAAPVYHESRAVGEIGPLRGLILKSGAFERYRDRRIAAGASISQLKIPHVVTDPRFLHEQFAAEILDPLRPMELSKG